LGDLGRGRSWPALDIDLRKDIASTPGLQDRLALALDGLEPTAIEDEEGRWRVYFADPAARDVASAAIALSFGGDLTVSAVDVADEGWAAKTQQALTAVQVGRIIVAPPWDVPSSPAQSTAAGEDPIVIVIEPSMGFGTGHHQSTRLCLRALQRLELAGAYVVDAGTGSGLLAIAAARLGAARVLAIDHDADAVTAARENTARNGVAKCVDVRLDDLATARVEPASIVLANLTAAVLRSRREQITWLVVHGGRLVASGFTHDQAALVLDAFHGFHVTWRDEEDDWLALTFERPQA
jgi:ribosomal protein L11 methyltransferase